MSLLPEASVALIFGRVEYSDSVYASSSALKFNGGQGSTLILFSLSSSVHPAYNSTMSHFGGGKCIL